MLSLVRMLPMDRIPCSWHSKAQKSSLRKSRKDFHLRKLRWIDITSSLIFIRHLILKDLSKHLILRRSWNNKSSCQLMNIIISRTYLPQRIIRTFLIIKILWKLGFQLRARHKLNPLMILVTKLAFLNRSSWRILPKEFNLWNKHHLKQLQTNMDKRFTVWQGRIFWVTAITIHLEVAQLTIGQINQPSITITTCW